jgi:small GTP-binding protein
VGKSSLMLRFTEGEFKQGLVGTAGVDYKLKNIVFGGKTLKIQIWDTAGQERYRTLTKSYYKGAAGIILVYDVCDPVSFENVDYWIKKIKKNADENVEVLLLGNKIDLINDRAVAEEEARKISEENGVAHFETSAKDSKNVDQAFKQLISNILNNQNL